MKRKQIMVILAMSVALLGTQVQNTYGTDEITADQGVVESLDVSAPKEEAVSEAVQYVETVVPVEESSDVSWETEEYTDYGDEDWEESEDEDIEDEDIEDEDIEDEDIEDEDTEDEDTEDEDTEDEDAKGEDTEDEDSEDEDSEDEEIEDEDSEDEDSEDEDSEDEDSEDEDSEDEDSEDEASEDKASEDETTESPEEDGLNVPDPEDFGDVIVRPTVQPADTPENAAMNQQVKEYIDQSYTPSEAFVSWCDKVKYSIDTPIEGLPSFINQEMVVGALKCQDEYGIPASVTIAQIIQESGFGRYGEGGENGQGLSYLAYGYNNLFGVKGTGTAGSVQLKTGEQNKDGSRYTITAGFRVYYTYTEAIEDRADLLTNYYNDLTDGVTDANTYAMKIGSRWATSILYGQHLIQNMERYDLYRLDRMTLQEYSELVGSFVNPCPGSTMTDGFGYRNVPIAGATAYHKGIDLGTGAYNLPTYAVKEGTVIYAGYDSGAGNMIVIDHGNGLVTKYMHHKAIYVEVGDEVVQGQQIGLSGTTGVSTGNHLHFQVEEHGIAVNPASYFKE